MTAAVLLYRAVTYLPPIPLGAIACLIWRHAPALIRSSPRNAGRRSGPAMQRDTVNVIIANRSEGAAAPQSGRAPDRGHRSTGIASSPQGPTEMFAGKRQAQVPRTDAGVLADAPWVCAASWRAARMSRSATRCSRSVSSASALRLLSRSPTTRSYSGPKRCWSRRRRSTAMHAGHHRPDHDDGHDDAHDDPG